ncbi:S-adenosylmethionine decarboxylase [Patescibacteria group bacterium]|nr:S-adenosylmethionine decarboxylase [Patescibacteria group bacterium]
MQRLSALDRISLILEEEKKSALELNSAKQISHQPFGWSLLADIYNCERGLGDKPDDFAVCYKFLEQLPDLIGTRKQSPPFLVDTDAKKYPDKAGFSGWVPLVESGIQVHTLIPTRFITIDVYSCRKFDPVAVLNMMKNVFRPAGGDIDIEYEFMPRGIKYPN